MKLSIVVPVYNDASAIKELIDRIVLMSISKKYSTEVILVDDGSCHESTWKELIKIKNEFPNIDIKLVRLAKNQGQHRATACGLLYAKGDVIITMDSDLQHPPEEIPKLVNKLLNEKLDMVYGLAWSGHSSSDKFFSWLFRFLFHEFGNKKAFLATSFRAITSSLAKDVIENYNKPYWQIDKPLQRLSITYDSIPVNHDKRIYGESNYSFLKKLFLVKNVCYYSNSFFYIIGITALLVFILSITSGFSINLSYPFSMLLIILSLIFLMSIFILRKNTIKECTNLKIMIAEIIP